MVKVDELEQPFSVAVPVMVAVIADAVPFVAVNEGMFAPLPFAASPMLILLFVHEKVAPGVLLVIV
jgi:hypothetical protein